MAPRKPSKAKVVERTPIAEWTAAALGLVLTLTVLGYSLWQGLSEGEGPPALSVSAEPAKAAGAGFVVPVTVRNGSAQTAAAVQVTGVLGGEERQATFAYVPGRGEAKGGLVFQQDPAAGRLELSVEGYEDP